MATKLLAARVAAPDTLFYGLGLAYLLYQGHVQCYRRRDGWYQVDGLGHIPMHELSALVGRRYAHRSHVHVERRQQARATSRQVTPHHEGVAAGHLIHRWALDIRAK